LPYTNAKVIYRVFREEKRIVSYSRNLTKVPTCNEDYQLLQNYSVLREDASIKLAKALTTDLLTEAQRAKIYQQNFDEFVTNPCLNDLYSRGFTFMGEIKKQNDTKSRLDLHVPGEKPKGLPIQSCSEGERAELEINATEEKQTLQSFLFPYR